MGDLVQRSHDTGACRSTALFSACGLYRYALTREWDSTCPRLLYIMLNPSKADERHNDPTVERCERRARQLGYGAFRVVNLFAFRATDPRDLKAAPAPEGPANMATVLDSAGWADTILCAWGVHGEHRDAHQRVTRALIDAGHPLHHLGLTKQGHPRHPLYVSYATQPARWQP